MVNVGYRDDPPPYNTLYCSQELPMTPYALMPEIRTEPKNLPSPLSSLTCKNIYDACIQYVKEHVFYSAKFVEQMALTDIFNGAAYHYTLETFVEYRKTSGSITPYSGQPIDGPENGPPPGLWDIVVHPPPLFMDERMTVEIPHTASVSPCIVCVGMGQVQCEICSGKGGRRCISCFGRGRKQGRRCFFCRGTGRRRCGRCVGNGQIRCMTCSGTGKIKYCEIITVTWTNHKDEFISDTSNLPLELCKTVTGKCLLNEEKQQVHPILDAVDPSIRLESARLVESHRVRYQSQRCLKQRQILVAIPLTKATYKWKTKSGEFYVFGEENKVYFQDYPLKYWCCTCF